VGRRSEAHLGVPRASSCSARPDPVSPPTIDSLQPLLRLGRNGKILAGGGHRAGTLALRNSLYKTPDIVKATALQWVKWTGHVV
jgi:hypothetical protein